MSDNNSKQIIGYTTGVYDLFHVGHLNILKKAKEQCDYLVVGVTTDDLSESYKKKVPYIPYEQRAQIVENIKYVDKVVPQTTMKKMDAWEQIKFNRMFVGGWKGTPEWDHYEKIFADVGVEIIYFGYTEGVSSTDIIRRVQNKEHAKFLKPS
ncbi:MAG: adenylyltransferase/cytidyltransferase family protein [Candidatus Magasanikbacteria bacterium]|jgi:glycerol-3-phosphate cytidylyltransferase|nr:adenylyltransferase/cytidyltransferase family protein [Candidatus Magasanikbacteria bacterium]MBT4220870.1 adenylyltransferase/cytidyltransferase family protein [Candidatus Magasanikbacteria bacterium]MBT4350332.1 adenylyltransferase/cytidyltransferase family protein [Candidatus Magasanikbacteria bacterium]MBT4541974.1 adenylyltransferase/cytidyltransferase family protein [Candidatus Magasanikbacteria bacterium]MBT6252809.1 adenylyltransferase/cytidyltransferase family protein [Candidatus Ma